MQQGKRGSPPGGPSAGPAAVAAPRPAARPPGWGRLRVPRGASPAVPARPFPGTSGPRAAAAALCFPQRRGPAWGSLTPPEIGLAAGSSPSPPQGLGPRLTPRPVFPPPVPVPASACPPASARTGGLAGDAAIGESPRAGRYLRRRTRAHLEKAPRSTTRGLFSVQAFLRLIKCTGRKRRQGYGGSGRTTRWPSWGVSGFVASSFLADRPLRSP